MTACDVAIVGAGPYGLSIAAHLRASGVNFRIFGLPMHTWVTHMPAGMHLKSEGFASSLYEPTGTFTLERHCEEQGIPYSRLGRPVPVEVFSSYGLAFQRRYVPDLETVLVTDLRRSSDGFRVVLEDGRLVSARRVVVAVGITHFSYIPPQLAALPAHLVTHSSAHHTLDRFCGCDVAVVGAGASALDLAALLHQKGARVQVLSRKPVIRFHNPPTTLRPSLLDRLRKPITGIGPGWTLFLCAYAPLLFHRMPQRFRLDKVRRVLGPAPCWFTKDQVVGKVGLNVGVKVVEVTDQNGRAHIELADSGGVRSTLIADHVIAATGYRVDLRRLAFVQPDLRSSIRAVEHTPVLSSNFESSVAGLYFVGVCAANSFGPLLRFAFGAGFTARRLSRHLAKSSLPSPVPSRPGDDTESEHSRRSVSGPDVSRAR